VWRGVCKVFLVAWKTATGARRGFAPALLLYAVSQLVFLAFFGGVITMKMAVLTEQTNPRRRFAQRSDPTASSFRGTSEERTAASTGHRLCRPWCDEAVR